MSKTKVFITPTTHWDREWVMTFGQFQVRLVHLIDNLLTIMDNNPDYRFLLDGQAIALEDYLEIRPEKLEKISALLQENRLVAGPWYVLADQFLENGESTIRNLLLGMRTIRELGGSPMMLGYIPDSFGSIGSMPMILNGFHIKYTSFGRGRPDWNSRLPHYEFCWESPDGSKVLAASHGYGNGIFLSYLDIWTDILQASSLNSDPDEVLARFMKEAEKQQKLAATPNLYFSVGVDHMEARKSLPELINYINRHQNEYELVYGTPEDYLKAVELVAKDLANYSGEMRGTELNPMDLVGTLSSYMPLKQQNDYSEILLQRNLEPLWVMVAGLTGSEYPKGHLIKLWRLLLANHPHDSICGCSIDQVHKDMQNRYEQIHHTGTYLIKEGLHHLLAKINTIYPDKDAIAVTVVNPLGRSHSGPVRGLIRVPKRFKHAEYSLVDSDGKTIPAKITHLKNKNKDLESVYMTNEQLAAVLSKDANEERSDDQVFTMLDVDFIASDVPGVGYKTFWIKSGVAEMAGLAGVKLSENGMENQYIKIRLNDNGTFDLFNKSSKHMYRSLNYFVDREDTGDLYDHHEFTNPEEFDSRDCTVKWQVHEQETFKITFKARIEWELPQRIELGKRSTVLKTTPITIYVTLLSDMDHLEVAIELDNQAKDHCLRVAFDTGLQSETVSAYDHFNVVERKLSSKDGEWRDEPFQEFIDASNGINGLCISTRGLPAYEAVQGDAGTQLLVTLVRSVGSVGSAAGANHPNPDGQCQGALRFEYAIIPHEGNWRAGDCLQNAADYRTRFLVEGDLQHEGILPATGSLLTVSSPPDSKPLISCLKQAEDGDGWIIRAWNSTDQDQFKLKSDFKIDHFTLTRLDESSKHTTKHLEEDIHMPVNGLTTLRFKL
ncbi:hypothetical protein EHS13_26975 [Paenibacillus psychroresistens]|uniref:Glycoside hydrolase family 38 central domain-containing protein n=1 Tax=Paenibacillus psychroresistens TaxID=1778678 RepID=A0A6B8RSF4_9BACL|nr:glycoside hydrolase family 38 C-terminal domain-containing protein [Paenibacillus psychroresistens]QGQ98266.1 hypothetical protein EHS13_26975 [Paenibacillus psychroresistens]